jgi:regulator of protease activity HflC (stomatin/prohibitin superfamily)
MITPITPAARLIAEAREMAERIAATPEGRRAARLSEGNPDLEALTRAIFGRDV